MPTNLANGTVNLGSHTPSIVRIAMLDTDCSPVQGADSGFVTTALVTGQADPVVVEGTVIEPKLANGEFAFRVEKPDRITRYDIQADFAFRDYEMFRALFGGSLLLGAAGGPYAGKVVGHAMPNDQEGVNQNGVYLEIITLAAYEDLGDCVPALAGGPGATAPYAIGHIFGKVKCVPGTKNFGEDAHMVSFTGKATPNPALFNGPWNDYPAAGYMQRSPHIEVVYSKAQYDAIAARIAVGLQALPAVS